MSEPSLKAQVFEGTRVLLDKLERELSLFKGSPPLVSEQQPDTFEGGASHPPSARPESAFLPPDRVIGGAAGAAVEKASTTISTCAKCQGHDFERGLITPVGERRAVPVLQCAGCGAVVGTLDPARANEDLQKRLAAIDAALDKIVEALSGGRATKLVSRAPLKKTVRAGKQQSDEKRGPGDEAVPGTPGTGEDVCPRCDGSGRVDGAPCPNCNGRGTIIRGIGGS